MKIRLTVTALAVAAAFPAFSQSTVTTDEAVMATTVVTATRQVQRVDEVLASVDVITREEIERAGNRTLVELLASRPGVQVTSNGGAGATSSVFIRGANASQTLLLIDGVRIGSATVGSPTFETIPLALVERIEILRGPASALYGADAIGGVVQVFTRRDVAGVKPRFHVGAGSRDTYTASAGVAGVLERVRFSFDAGHDRTRGFDAQPGLITGVLGDRDGWRNDYFNGSVTVGFRENDEFGLSHWYTDGRNWYDSNWSPDFNSYLDKRSQSTTLHVRNQLGSGWQSTIRLGQSKDLSHNRSSPASASEFDTVQRQFMWQHDIDLPRGDLMVAYERLVQRIESTGSYDETKRAVNSWLLGWGDRFGDHALQANLRRDQNSQFGGRTTGTLSYGYQISDQLALRSSVGTGFRVPTFNDLYSPFGGDPALKPERSRNLEFGLEWYGDSATLSATVFRNSVSDLIEWQEIAPWVWAPANVNNARLSGLELSSSFILGDYRLRANYDYLRAKDRGTGKQLVRRAKHSASLAVDRRFGMWHMGAELDLQSRRRDIDGYMGGYGVTNIFANYAFAPDWQLEMRVNNVFDKHYELAKGYATPGVNAFIGVRYAPR